MPNSPVRRLENCYRPPKKFAWRSDNTKQSEFNRPTTKEQKPSTPTEGDNHTMGQLSNNDVNPVDQVTVPVAIRDASPAREVPTEDAPLDFSIKPGSVTRNKFESVNQVTNNELRDNNRTNHQVYPSTFPVVFNGHYFHPTVLRNNESPRRLESRETNRVQSQVAFDSRDKNSTDGSQSSEESGPQVNNGTNAVNGDVYSSPERSQFSRENSPENQRSILEEMLRVRQQSNGDLNMQTPPTAFPPGYRAHFDILGRPILSSPSPPVPGVGSMMHSVNNFLPLPVTPYLGLASGDPRAQLAPSYLAQLPDSSFINNLSMRKHKKKRSDAFCDPFKSCSVDELRNKLQSLNGESSLNTDTDVTDRTQWSPTGDQGRNFSRDNCEPQQSAITNANSSMPMPNSAISNGTPNGHSADDTNDSVSSATPETVRDDNSADARKRKATSDSAKDAAYWARRHKNNLAAKRSRETRRLKEELVRKTATAYEAQNQILLREATGLKINLDEAQVQYFQLLKEYESIKIQNSILLERLNQKRCGQCGNTLPNVNGN